MSEPVYRVYCTNCETEVTKSTAPNFTDPEPTGTLIAKIFLLYQQEQACCYNGTCTLHDYQIQKSQRKYKPV